MKISIFNSQQPVKIVNDMLNILANFIAVAMWYGNQTDLLTFSVCIKLLAAVTQKS